MLSLSLFYTYYTKVVSIIQQLYDHFLKKMPSSSGAPLSGDADEHLARQLFF